MADAARPLRRLKLFLRAGIYELILRQGQLGSSSTQTSLKKNLNASITF